MPVRVPFLYTHIHTALTTATTTIPQLHITLTNKIPNQKGFISKSWHITSKGMFAGSCIGVICLVMTLEFLRRLSREYDLFILRQTAASSNGTDSSGLALASRSRSEGIDADVDAENIPAKSTPSNCNPPAEAESAAAAGEERGRGRGRALGISIIHHLIRTLLHTAQFVVAYIVMLLAMYYNGYVIICIFVGAFLGALVFGWDGVRVGGGSRFGYVLDSFYRLMIELD